MKKRPDSSVWSFVLFFLGGHFGSLGHCWLQDVAYRCLEMGEERVPPVGSLRYYNDGATLNNANAVVEEQIPQRVVCHTVTNA